MKKIFLFSFTIFLYFLANFYIFYHIYSLLSEQSIILKSIFFLLVFFLPSSFILFLLFSKKLSLPSATILYKISTSWPVVLLYSFLLFLVYDGLLLLNKFGEFIPENFFNNNYGIILILCLVVCIGFYGYRNYFNKRRIYLKLTTNKKLIKPLKIVMISDLHLGYAIQGNELKSWINKINKEQPDLVLIVGDIIDTNVKPLQHFLLEKHFKKIKSRLGIYSCLGNHEYISGITESIDFIKNAGIHLLRDSSILIENSFYIVGRDDRTNSSRKPLNELIKDLDSSKPIIVLDHQPYHLEESELNQVDIQFSGHTHQGQVWPISLITKSIFEKSHGYLKKGNTHIYVSSGIGIWGGRFRIGTNSEYVVVDFLQDSTKN
ncbi:metallophosphoesterase [Apibacter mensalis]|uniref:metallophosphoesterase n=1 Tax=Apibacter mensalis TaxID=1586267 RepID=UPI0026EDD6AA|nr:metallophosphoesterase [Apibacter mensalis]